MSDHAERGSASVEARPGQTGEPKAETDVRAAAEEGEMVEVKPERLHDPAVRGLVSSGNSSSSVYLDTVCLPWTKLLFL